MFVYRFAALALLSVVAAVPAAAQTLTPVVLKPIQQGDDDDYEPEVRLYQVAWSPDGKTVMASGRSYEGGEHTANILWDIATGRERMRLRFGFAPYERAFPAACFLGEGEEIAVRDRYAIHIVEAETGKELRKFDEECLFFVPSPDGKRLAVLKGYSQSASSVEILDAATGRQAFALDAGNSIADAAFSADGKHFGVARDVGGASRNALKIWDTETWERTGTSGEQIEGASGILFTPDGNRVLSEAGKFEPTWLWTMPTLQPQMQLKSPTRATWEFPYFCACTPDSRVIVGFYKITVHEPKVGFWTCDDGKLVGSFFVPSEEGCLAFFAGCLLYTSEAETVLMAR